MEVQQLDTKIHLSQQLFINEKLISKGRGTNKIQTFPMSSTINLPRSEPNPHNDSLLPTTGLLRYLADHCRHDIQASVGMVSTGGDKSPSDNHVLTAQRIIDYVISTKEATLSLGGKGSLTLFALTYAARDILT